jgi:hypothetical protein
VADGLEVLQRHAALDVERADLVADRTGSAAVGAGLLIAEGRGLLFQKGLQGPFAESVGGRLGDLLQGVEIESEGCVVGAGASGDDFAPLDGELSEFLEFGGGELASWHEVSCLGVKTTMGQ